MKLTGYTPCQPKPSSITESVSQNRDLRLIADAADLAAAIQTILEIGDREGLGRAIDDAFPGSEV